MLYFVFLTHRCNLKCHYCGEITDPQISVPQNISYSLDTLIKFLSADFNPIIVFYGGEPLLEISSIEKIMDQVNSATFVLQTNGLLLNKLKESYLKRFRSILVSIDGNESITDSYRGKGTYRRIIRNIKAIYENGFKGDLIARMTVSFESNIYESVNHLINLSNPSFDHVHWQLDVIWSSKGQYEDFSNWVRNEYNPGITKLIDEWGSTILKLQRVPGIIPFKGIIHSLITKSNAKLRCGAGIDAFAIQTDGKIYACPVSTEFDDFKVGDIFNSKQEDLEGRLHIKEPCNDCEVFSICGGRCLFTNHHNLWGEDFFTVCETVKHLISELKKIQPSIEELITKNKIKLEMLEYPTFNNSTEIIP